MSSDLTELGQEAIAAVSRGVADGASLVKCALLASAFYEALRHELRKADATKRSALLAVTDRCHSNFLTARRPERPKPTNVVKPMDALRQSALLIERLGVGHGRACEKSQYWRKCAEWARRIANAIHDEQARRLMLSVAKERRRGPLSGRTCSHVLAPCRSYPGSNFVIASQHARQLCRAQNLGPQGSSGPMASHINGPDCTLTDLKSLGCVGNDRLHLLAPLPSHGNVSCNSSVKRVL
jgi:hypothetical protein